MPRISMRLAPVALLAMGIAAPTLAQQTPTVHFAAPPLQFNFAPPGARSLAMGASFIGLADDATASESNPAGLTILTKPEFSAHFRYTKFENEAPNTVLGRGFQTFDDYVGSPSFFSGVLPLKRAALSFYYQRAADFRQHSFFDGVNPEVSLPSYDQVRTSFNVENWGLSGAVKAGSKLSVGASLRLTRADIDSVTLSTFPLSNPVLFVKGGSEFAATKSKATFNAGVLVTPTSKVSLGAVFKKGASFTFPTQFKIYATDGVDTVPIETDPAEVEVTIPDSFGGGVALRPSETFVITVDVLRVKWGDTNPKPGEENFYAQLGQGGPEVIEDKTEFHAGAEYTWASGSDWLFAARAGYYHDPDHDGLAGIDSAQDHFTFGGGFVAKNRVQIDVAANVASRIKEGLLSVVFRF